MKQLVQKMSFLLLAAGVMAPAAVLAQKDDKEKKEVEQIIITRKGDKEAKTVIEVNGDKITVNGKAVDEKDKDGEVTVHRTKIKDFWSYGNGLTTLNGSAWNDHFALIEGNEDRAVLGVTTEKADKGAEIQIISKDGGAEKAGLKKGDVITKIDDKAITTPDELSTAVRAHKPGDKVSVTYLRDGKEQKVTAELGKWKGVGVYAPGQQYYNMNIDVPGFRATPRTRINGQAFSYSTGGAPKLGLSVQDTDDGKGVKVIDVDEDGNASKAGIKENDIITEVDGKAVNGADEIANIIKENKDKVSVKVKLQRNGKTENLEVKIPRKLKTANL